MDGSVFWARFLGLYLIILHAGAYLHIHNYQAHMAELVKAPLMLLIIGIFTIPIGIAILVTHQVWKGWPIIVTLLGYWITYEGIVFMFFPEWLQQMTNFWNKNFYLAPLPGLVIGVILLICGLMRRKHF